MALLKSLKNFKKFKTKTISFDNNNNNKKMIKNIIFSPDNDYERRLPRDKLYVMCKYEPVQKYVRKSDYQFYQALVEVLIPDVLRPIPSKLLFVILETCLRNVGRFFSSVILENFIIHWEKIILTLSPPNIYRKVVPSAKYFFTFVIMNGYTI